MGRYTKIIGILLLVGVVWLALNHTSGMYSYKPWIIGTAEPAGEFEEIVTLPVNTEQELLTTRSYSGTVTITIRGEGRLKGNFRHDAICAFVVDEECSLSFGGFTVNGIQPIESWFFHTGELSICSGPPFLTYNPSHEYQFMYTIGAESKHIAFQMRNGNPDDTSEFNVKVDVRMLLCSPGR